MLAYIISNKTICFLLLAAGNLLALILDMKFMLLISTSGLCSVISCTAWYLMECYLQLSLSSGCWVDLSVLRLLTRKLLCKAVGSLSCYVLCLWLLASCVLSNHFLLVPVLNFYLFILDNC